MSASPWTRAPEQAGFYAVRLAGAQWVGLKCYVFPDFTACMDPVTKRFPVGRLQSFEFKKLPG